MLYEVITNATKAGLMYRLADYEMSGEYYHLVITSYSIHYTKLYETNVICRLDSTAIFCFSFRFSADNEKDCGLGPLCSEGTPVIE